MYYYAIGVRISVPMYIFEKSVVALGDVMATMNKERLNLALSSEAKQRAVELGATREFGSASNFVESAIWYYLGAREKNNELAYERCRKELEKVKEAHERDRNTLLIILSHHQELLDEVNNTEG